MKKIILAVLFLGITGLAKADSIKFDVGGGLVLDVPLTEVDAVGLWNFRSKTGLAGAETPLFGFKVFQITGGAVTSVSGQGSPFVRTYLSLPNPIGNFASFEALKPGVFVGRDFNQNDWIFGLAASMPIW